MRSRTLRRDRRLTRRGQAHSGACSAGFSDLCYEISPASQRKPHGRFRPGASIQLLPTQKSGVQEPGGAVGRSDGGNGGIDADRRSFVNLAATLAGWITAVISAGGYAGVAALMALESACIPLPSEVIMPFAGYLATTGRFTLWGVALAGAIGCNIGSSIAYAVGATGGRRAIDRFGHWALLDQRDIERAEWFFARFGRPAVFIGRLLPVVRTFIALPAGIARMPQLPFQLYTFAGSLIWCYVLAYLGYQLGRRWENDPALRSFLSHADVAIVVLMAAGVAWFLWRRIRRPRA